MTDSFYSQPITTTPNRTYELTFSENVNNPKQSKTSTNSLKFSKSTTIAAKGSPSKPRKKLKSYRKSESPSNKLLEFNFLNLILKFFQFIDNVLYYLVFFLCQLPLLLLKLVIIPIFGFSKKLTLWFKSQLKKPIKIPRFRSFQLYSTKFLVLDLDETLVRCTKERPTFECEEIVVIHKGNKVERYFLSKRPHLDHFFDELSKFYTFVVFTSSVKEYADIVINRIDNKKLIKHRYYREVPLFLFFPNFFYFH